MRLARCWMREGAILAWLMLAIPFGIVGTVAVIAGLMAQGLMLLFQAAPDVANLTGATVALFAGGVASLSAFKFGLELAEARARRLRNERSEREWAAYKDRTPSQREVAGG